MATFHQTGIITTLHPLYEAFDRDEYLANLENKLEGYSRHLKIALLLPSLYSEIKNPQVLDKIIDDLQHVNYIHRIVVALGGATDANEFEHAKDYFSRLRTPRRDLKVLWVDGPRIQDVFHEIQNKDVSTGVAGKGQSVWIALGYLLARKDCNVIALHDCDIVTYDRTLLGRLVEPTANPNNDFEFCKGYYARISPENKMMKGRVTRLFVTPFVDTMSKIMRERGFDELRNFFMYHRTFNYPLAGEFSFNIRLAHGINIAYDWGLEVSTLSEVYRRVMPQKIAQIDLTCNYEHKHQDVSPENMETGLHRMVIDIAKFYLNYIRSHGVPLDDAFVDMILHSYYENALLFIKSYSDDAEVNDLAYNRYDEEITVRHFRGFLWTAWEQCRGPHESTLIPSWNRVLYSIPDIYNHLNEAVEKDNA
jgi:glucosyl-3-phosphoglycerate synthase